jgi:tRNA(Phe) wybutosine-synthesizing methylase Tyw3
MEFKKTKIYAEIMSTETTFSVPFHTKSGLTITENNVDYIIEIEIKKAKAKIEMLNDAAYIFNNIEEKIINQYRNSINKPYLNLEFAYLNHENVDDGIKTIENSPNFYEWLVE